ncbi:hypothetical protein GCM10017566_18260 [Amycolatopsis bartoniae]|uniref:Uncharacterized protein n=1 Tax=Amycolatopsis bartoniae TaxID=941986 RepID=A0A8H9IY28_9PSEU|nr:hypothetical protein GCM10017566_18260 [Amycolatopsis bartoniae]
MLRPARRLLLAASVVTLLLNVADPVCADQWGKAGEPAAFPHGQQVGADLRRATALDEDLVERARRADADHWRRYRRPISVETLRKQLRVGATKFDEQ